MVSGTLNVSRKEITICHDDVTPPSYGEDHPRATLASSNEAGLVDLASDKTLPPMLRATALHRLANGSTAGSRDVIRARPPALLPRFRSRERDAS